MTTKYEKCKEKKKKKNTQKSTEITKKYDVKT